MKLFAEKNAQKFQELHIDS